MWLGPFLGLDFQRTCHAMYTLTFAVFQVRWEHIEEYLHAFLIVYWWPEICFLQVQQVSRNRSEEISDYESEKILNEALEHGHGSGRPGYGNPPNKKGKSNITLINTKLQHPLPPLRCRLCPGVGNLSRNLSTWRCFKAKTSPLRANGSEEKVHNV